MSLQPINTHAFITQCIENARESLISEKEDLSVASSIYEQDSVMMHYLEGDKYNSDELSIPCMENNSLSTTSLTRDDEQCSLDTLEMEDLSAKPSHDEQFSLDRLEMEDLSAKPSHNSLCSLDNANTPK
jgi:hypothetical protein